MKHCKTCRCDAEADTLENLRASLDERRRQQVERKMRVPPAAQKWLLHYGDGLSFKQIAEACGGVRGRSWDGFPVGITPEGVGRQIRSIDAAIARAARRWQSL